MEIEALPELLCKLGEVPVWDEQTQRLYVVDIIAPAVLGYDPSTRRVQRWVMPSFVGSMALRAGGGAIVALANGVHSFDFETGEAILIANPEADEPRAIFTEGQVDPRGRFVFSSFDPTMQETIGSLYVLDSDHKVRHLTGNIKVPNGICWSPDGRHLYLTDSGLKTVFRFDYDLDSGTISNPSVYLEIGSFVGVPDGAAFDDQGYYWVAHCGGGELVRFDPAGNIDRRVAMPGQYVSSLVFGGADLDEIYVTSLHPSILQQDGTGGETYIVRGLGVRGLPQRRFNG